MKRGRNWGDKKESKVISLRLEPDLKEWLETKGNYSEFIRDILWKIKNEENKERENG